MNHRPGIRPALMAVAACALINAAPVAASVYPVGSCDCSMPYVEPNRRGPTNAREYGEQLNARRRRRR